MPANSQDTQLAQAGRFRIWVQEATYNPLQPYGYAGCMELNKPSQDLGALEPVYCPDPAQRNKWNIVDVVARTPALPKADFTQHANRQLRDQWFRIRDRGCLINVQAVISACQRPDDFSKFDAKMVLNKAKLTKMELSDLNPLSGEKNSIVDISGSLEAQGWTFIYPLAFENAAEVTVVAELLDAFFYDQITCGDCGAPSDGCQKLYLLQVSNTGSPGLSSQVIYSQDGGATWASNDINTLGGVSASRFAPFGSYAIAVSQNSLAYHYNTFASLLANTAGGWTSQASGFVAGKAPRCLYSKNASQMYIGAAGGYIYYLQNVGSAVSVLTDGSATSQNINDIQGYGRTIVAVGDSNAMLVSSNDGATWLSVTGPAVGQSLTSVALLNENVIWVGTNNGKLFVSLNKGTTWTQIVFDAGGFTVINDIQWVDDTVGYIAVEISGAGRVYRTTDGGSTWYYNNDAIQGLPTNQRINAVAPCGYNTVAAAGRKTIGGDGILAIAD